MNQQIQTIIKSLSDIPRVQFIGLGGSRGLGLESPESDYDVVIFREDGDVIDHELILNVLRPFINLDRYKHYRGFIETEIDGKYKLEIFQKRVQDVKNELVNMNKGAFRMIHPKLMPFGSISTIIISHIVYFKICEDKFGVYKKLIESALPMSLLLKKTLLSYFSSQLDIILIHANKIKSQQDCQYFLALMSHAVYCINILIFASNDRYPILERGGSQYIVKHLKNIPKDYESLITRGMQLGASGKYQECMQAITLLRRGIDYTKKSV